MFIFVSIIYLICIALIIVNGILWWFGISSWKWPKTAGFTTSTNIKRNSYPTKSPNEPIVRFAYLPQVEYRYEVDGKCHNSKRICFGLIDREYGEKSDAEAVLKMAEGGEVTVFYHPRLPFISLLNPSSNEPSTYVLAVVLTSLVMVGLYFVAPF